MYKQLTSEQRYTISILLQQGMLKKNIAAAIKVSPSTITREIKRNSGTQSRYNWKTAQRNAAYHKHRSAGNRAIKSAAKEKALKFLTEEQWSPEQISCSLKKSGDRISFETIYGIIRKDKAEGGELYKNCRHKLKHRSRPVGEKRITIPDRISIDERPKEANEERLGDFELDTIVGKGNKGAIVTLVDRKTGYMLMRKSNKGKDAQEIADIVVKLLMPFRNILKSITTDNGVEFTNHKYMTEKLGVTVYFADPHAPWQKPLIENTNGIIRQYIPKGTDFDEVSHQFCTKIQHKINMRPRKKLEYRSPHECFYNNMM